MAHGRPPRLGNTPAPGNNYYILGRHHTLRDCVVCRCNGIGGLSASTVAGVSARPGHWWLGVHIDRENQSRHLPRTSCRCALVRRSGRLCCRCRLGTGSACPTASRAFHSAAMTQRTARPAGDACLALKDPDGLLEAIIEPHSMMSCRGSRVMSSTRPNPDSRQGGNIYKSDGYVLSHIGRVLHVQKLPGALPTLPRAAGVTGSG